MAKKYIRTNEDGVVSYIHYNPFDPLFGLNKTEDELLLSGGYIVDEIPVAENREGFIGILKYTANDSGDMEFTYDYVRRSDSVSDRVSSLENLMNYLIEDGGIVFEKDSDGNLTGHLSLYIEYIASQIKDGNLDYDMVIEKYPEIKDDLDTIL